MTNPGCYALADFNAIGRLVCVYAGEGSELSWVRYSAVDHEWSEPYADPRHLVGAHCGAAEYRQNLYFFHDGEGEFALQVARTPDGQNWGPDEPVATSIGFGPAATAVGDHLYCVYSSPYDIQWTGFDSASWSPGQWLGQGYDLGNPPALARFRNKPYCVFDTTESSLSWGSFENGAWSPPQQIPNGPEVAVPALARTYVGDRLVCVYYDDYSPGKLQQLEFDGAAWKGPTTIAGVTDAGDRPALALHGDKIYCVYRSQ
ncbi:hypothetical protein [Kitasatospora sp. NPDC056184]|uniref:hypothetical protein n=1 Tax=Kitasatospora sp. NPDC056184 TaxID=3345738 RepID=UPI0035D868DC